MLTVLLCLDFLQCAAWDGPARFLSRSRLSDKLAPRFVSPFWCGRLDRRFPASPFSADRMDEGGSSVLSVCSLGSAVLAAKLIGV